MSSMSLNTSTIAKPDLRITVASHHIRVTDFGPRVKSALMEFCRGLAQYGYERMPNGRFQRAMLRVFVGVSADRSFFHFHRNELSALQQHLKLYGIRDEVIQYEYLIENLGHATDFTVIDKRTPREDQVPKIEYVGQPGVSKIITVDPGRGKTFMALTAIAAYGRRVFICIKAMYIKKWIGDIEAAFKLKKGDLMVIQGSAQLSLLTNLAKEGALDAKIIICSNTTFYNYLKDYEKFQEGILDLGYGCTPPNFYQTCGIGFRLIDEVHQDYHLNYRQDLYMHCQKALSLSGTLEGDDDFLNRRKEIMFPKHERIDNGERVIYTTVEALTYRLRQPTRLKWINKARKSYSHIMFEQSLMEPKNKDSLRAYLEMNADLIQQNYRRLMKDGQKCLMYFATVEMCTLMADYLRPRHSDLKVMRYTAEDDFDEMLESDIIVSTLKSLGTAQDIPKLLHVYMTDGLGSSQANLQAMGRLRDTILKIWPDAVPTFYYLVCEDIEKHIEYHERKKETFQGRVVSHLLFSTDHVI
ncbi:hypothetical protein D3C81_193420 [compost metagenome]